MLPGAAWRYGEQITELDGQGNRVADDSFLLLFNAHSEPLTFTLPDREWGRRWAELIDSTEPAPTEAGPVLTAGGSTELGPRSVLALRRVA